MAESEDARPAIGIDLGTTNSRVGIWLDEENRFQLISNYLGHHTTPSYVAFTETERLIGDAAKDQASKNPANTVFDVKRLIGRKFGDLGTDADKLHIQWPFKVARGGDEKPMIHVEYRGKEKVFSAVDVYVMILEQMKDLAEVYSGCVVDSASVSVPHCFTSAQRQATRNACSLAGFETVSLVNEPVCAALAYTLKTIGPSVGEKKVMVFDLGGGSLDVTLFTIEEGVIEAKATSGESQLGGEDFDLRLLHHFVSEIKQKYERDITSHPRVMRTLKKQVERVKVTLSTELDATIQIDSLLEDFSFYSSISRGCFEEMNVDLFENCIRCVAECLQRAGLAKADVDEVVLVGGSSRIPKVQELLAEFFNNRSKLNTSINPDEAVVCGAAARAGIARGCSAFTDYLVVDVIPMSLGLETVGGAMHVVHPRNSSIPRSSEQLFTTVHDDQPGIFIQVYEGEDSHTCNNMLIATVELPGIPPAPHGVPQILVRFDVDACGILTVSAKDKTTGEKVEVCMDQEVDIDRVHHDEERRQGLSIQVYHSSSPSEDSNGSPSLLGQREPSNTRKGSPHEFSEPSPAYRPSIAIESTSQELPVTYESRNIAESSRSQEISEPSPAFEPSNIVESGPVKISEPFPGYEPSNAVKSESQEVSEPSPAFESSNAVEFFEAPQAFEPEESRSFEFLEPPVAYGLSDTIEKSSQESAEPPQVHESNTTVEINKSQQFSEPQASESSNAVNGSSSKVFLVQEILDTAHVITPISDFKTHKRECSTFIRRVNMLVPLFEEFRDLELSLSEEVLACFNALETALNTAKGLLLLCSKGSKLWLILEERKVAEQFLLLNTALVQALDKLPDSLGISDEVREQVDLVHSQLKRSKALEDAVDAQLNAELVSILDETNERSPDQLKRLAESFKLDTESALRKESEALDGMSNEKAPGSLSMQGFDQIFGLISDLNNLFPLEDLEQHENSKAPGEDGSSNVVESRIQESSGPPPPLPLVPSNSGKSVEGRPQEISAQAPPTPYSSSNSIDGRSLEYSEPTQGNRDEKLQEFSAPPPPQGSRGVESRAQELSPQLPQVSRAIESSSQEISAQLPQGSRGLESRAQEFSTQSAQISRGVESRSQEISAEPPQVSRGVESRSQEIYAQAPQASRGVESRAQEFFAQPPQVSRGVESRAQETYAQPPQVSRGVEGKFQELSAQPAQVSRSVDSRSQDIYAQAPQASRGVETRAQETYAQPPQASRGVESRAQETYAQPPQASRGVESRAQETYAQPPQGSRGVEGKFQEFSPQSPQASRGVEGKFQEFSPQSPQASRGVESRAQETYAQPPQASRGVESRAQETHAQPPQVSRGVEGKFQEFSPQSPQTSRGVESRAQETYAQPPQASRGVESRAQETYAQPPQVSRGVEGKFQEFSPQSPQASRGVEGKFQEFSPQSPQASRGVEGKFQEFSPQSPQASRGVESRAQETYAQPPQASRGVESRAQETYAQPPQVSRGVEGKFQEFSPQSPQASRGVEGKFQEFSPQSPQASRGVEGKFQEFSPQSPQASRGVESRAQETYAQPPQVSRGVEGKFQEFSPQSPQASRGVEGKFQEFSPQSPQASRGVEGKFQEFSPQSPQASRGVEGKFQEFSPQSPQASRGVESRAQETYAQPPQASRGVESRAQETYAQPPQVSRGVEGKFQEFSPQPPQTSSRGVESRPQEFSAQPPQASRGVEGKFQEFSLQPPQPSRGVESRPQEFSAQAPEASRGVESRPQEFSAQPPQASRGVEGKFQEFSLQPPQPSRGVESRPQEFSAQAPEASRGVESRPQEFSPQLPQVSRGVESRSQEFSPQSPYSSSNSIDGRSLEYPEPPPVNRDVKIKSQELSAPPPPLSSNSSNSIEGRSQEFSPQPQVSRGVESRSQEFSPRPPRSPYSSSNSIDDRSLEYPDPPQVNRDEKKLQEFSPSPPTHKSSHSFEGRPPHDFSEAPQGYGSSKTLRSGFSQEFPEYSSRPEFPELSPEYKAWNGLEGRPPEPSEPLATHRLSSSSGSSRRHAPSELSPVHKSSNVSDSRRHDHPERSPTSSSTSEVSSEEFSGSGPFRARGGIPIPASDSPELHRAATSADGALYHPPRPENHARSESCPQVQTSDSFIEDVVKKYTWEQVLDMTNELTKTIGKGGFGAVYLGKLANEKEVAVKILDASSQQGITEFLNEVNLLKRVNHINLVRLLGYCLEEKQVLVYEYAEEGSIWDHLQVGGKSLDWKRRLNVALQSACGLEYLHTGCHPRIIHRDIKSQNILLTKSMVAKVADFGLSKLGADQDNVSKTHVTTMVKGTLGYLDPEYLKTGQLTEKSDVYSFGVVLLEIITGRKPIQNTDRKGFIGDWVEEHYSSSTSSSRGLKSVADPTLGGHFNSKALKLVLNVAKECLHPYGIERPEMTEVVQVLRKAQMIENDEKKSSKWLPFL